MLYDAIVTFQLHFVDLSYLAGSYSDLFASTTPYVLALVLLKPY